MTHFKQDVQAPWRCWPESEVEWREWGLQLPQADANLIHTAAQATSTLTWCTVLGLLSFNQCTRRITKSCKNVFKNKGTENLNKVDPLLS